jgi:hypothetical protein
MKSIELLKEAQDQISKGIQYLEENTFESILKYFSLGEKKNHIRNITSYQNEAEERASELFNEYLINTGYTTITSKGSVNNSTLTLKYKGFNIAEIDLHKKRLYYFKNIEKLLYKTNKSIEKFEKEVIIERLRIESFTQEQEQVKLKKIPFYKSKEKAEEQLEEQYKYLEDNKKLTLVLISELQQSITELGQQVNLYNKIILTISILLEKFTDLSFSYEYFPHIKHKYFSIYENPDKNMSYSDSEYEKNNIVILNVGKFNSIEKEFSLTKYLYSKQDFDTIVNLITNDNSIININVSTLKNISVLHFEKNNIIYEISTLGDISIKGEKGHVFDLFDYILHFLLKKS